ALLALTGEDRRGSALDAGVDHVPEAVRAAGDAADGAVADEVLLVAVEPELAGDGAVGDEPAAGEVVRRAVVLERHAAVDDDPAQRGGLRDRPDLGAVVAAGAVGVGRPRRVGRRRLR